MRQWSHLAAFEQHIKLVLRRCCKLALLTPPVAGQLGYNSVSMHEPDER